MPSLLIVLPNAPIVCLVWILKPNAPSSCPKIFASDLAYCTFCTNKSRKKPACYGIEIIFHWVRNNEPLPSKNPPNSYRGRGGLDNYDMPALQRKDRRRLSKLALAT